MDCIGWTHRHTFWLVISRALHSLLFTAHYMHLYTYFHACIICSNVVSIYIWSVFALTMPNQTQVSVTDYSAPLRERSKPISIDRGICLGE